MTHSAIRPMFSLRSVAIVMTLVLGVAACDRSGTAPASSGAATAVIGPAGGTLTGPDGVQVEVPAGALDQPTTIGIALSSAGAPASYPEDITPAGSIYEFTPHDVVFNAPVIIRMPVPANATGAEVFMASPGGEWQVQEATVTGHVAEWQRNSFSWGMNYACAPANNPPYSSSNPDPYPCHSPRGAASASATPTSAITQRTYPNPFGSAGSWEVTEASTVHLTLTYQAAPDCGNGRVKLLRWNPATPLNTPNRVQTLFDQAVTLTQTTFTNPPTSGGGTYVRAAGSTTLDVAFSHLDNGTTAFGFSFSCNRPFRSARTGGDLLTFVSTIPVPSVTYVIGGTVSGLTGTGLVLQNNGGDNLAVSADGAFTFATAIAANAPYSVSVQTQPSGQTCTVQNGSSTAQADVSNVAVSCTAAPPTGPVPLVATTIAAGFYNSLAVASNGTVWAWGYQVDPITGGYKSNSPWATVPVQVQGLTGVKAVALTSESAAFYALHTDGTVSAWGRNNVGQLGDRTTTTRTLPVKVLQDPTTPMDEVCSIAASASILLMARETGCSPGSRAVATGPWIAGLFNGQAIGGDTSTPSPLNGAIAKAVPGWPAGARVSQMSTADAASAGGAVFFITSTGGRYVWGDNGGNRLGAGVSVPFAGSSAGPVPPPDGLFWSGIGRVELGRDFSIAIGETSTLVGVGRNLEGQLGNNSTNASSSLVDVLILTNVTDFSVGQVGAAAITSGQLWAWGWNGTSAVTQPTRVGPGTGFTAVSVGDVHSLAVGPGGEVYSWGDGTYGGLGNGATSGSRSIPAVVMRP